MITLESIKDVITIVCLIYGVITARNGLDTWKKQLRSSVKYDLAKKIFTTASVSSFLIKNLNREINWIFYIVNQSEQFDQSDRSLNQRRLEKLSQLQTEMEILKEEANATLESNASSYDNLCGFIENYTHKVGVFALTLNNKDDDIDRIKKECRQVLEDHVPLVPEEAGLALRFMHDQPDYHADHAELINKVKSDMKSYMRHARK